MSVVEVHPAQRIESLPPRVKFTRETFHDFVERELQKGDRRFELVEGDIVEKMSQKEPHLALIMRWIFALARVFGEAYVRNQGSVVLSKYSELEPDVFVTSQESNHYVREAMTPPAADIRLLIEVSATTLHYDTRAKARLYARSGIPDYWVLDVAGRRLLVHRDPTADGYASVMVFAEDESVSPLAAPTAAFAVEEFLP